MGLKPRRKPRARQPAAYRRRLQKRLIASDPAKPSTWRAWKIGRRWWQYPLAVEWALEWFVYRLRSLALFELLELAGKLTVLVAVIFWFLEADNRAKERHYRAWELINAARGSTGDGGRKDALQDLNKDGVSLAAAPLEQAHLPGIDLEGADLWMTNFKRANLGLAFPIALKEGVYYSWRPKGDWGAGANLRDANLSEANFEGANLAGADLSEANFNGANLQNASLLFANLQGAFLWYANLQDADFEGADLRGADLSNARFVTQEQLDAANGDDRTVLPDGLARPAHWSKAEGRQSPPAAQPDDAKRAPAEEGAPGSGK